MDRKFIPILPLPGTLWPSETATTERTPISGGATSRRRRPSASIACEPCRARKSGCDGARPSCASCLKRRLSCSYRSTTHSKTDELLRRLRSHEELVAHLRSLPEEDAVDLLRRLRGVADPEAFLASTEGGAAHSWLRPSELRTARWIGATARWIGAPAQTETEFELMARHPAAYLKITPVSTSFLERVVTTSMNPSPRLAATDLGSRSTSSQESQEAKLHQSLQLQGSAQKSTTAAAVQLDPQTATARSAANPSTPRVLRTLPSPLPRGTYCDERLLQLQMDYWTRVPVADEFAAAVLSHYLEQDHLILGIFDADVVLDDLITNSSRFCSPFFVSALMYISCVAVDLRAAPLSVCFFKEAEMLYRGEAAADSVATVAATMIYGVSSLFAGKDAFGQELLDSARHMAERLGLFGVPPHSPEALSLRTQPKEWIKMASHSAWGSFNFLGLFSNFYPRKPIRYPSMLLAPGERSGNASRDGYSSGAAMLPPQPPLRHTSPFFNIVCRLWIVANEVAQVYRYESDVPISKRVPLAYVQAKFEKLLDCMDQLPEDIGQSGVCPLHVLVLYISFHIIVLSILHPFIGDSASIGRLRSFTSPNSQPKAIYAASVNQVKQLTLWSHLQHGKSISVFVNPAFLVLVGRLLNDDDEPNRLIRRLYFLLCIRCCADLEISYPIYAELTQAFLVMALQRRVVSGSEASALLMHLKQRGSHHAVADEAIVACFPDLFAANTSSGMASVHAVAQLFEDLSLFSEFTTAEDYSAFGRERVVGQL